MAMAEDVPTLFVLSTVVVTWLDAPAVGEEFGKTLPPKVDVPTTEKIEIGEEELIPTFPFCKTVSKEAPVEEFMLKRLVPPMPCIAKEAMGLEEFMPNLLATYKFVEVIMVPLAVVNVNDPARFVGPETYQLVVEALTNIALVEVIAVPLAVEKVKEPAKLVGPETYRLVVVAFVNKPLVEVIMVPLAVVKIRPPDRVPPVKSR